MLSDKYADASAAIIESAQTGHVGRSLPRGAERGMTVDGISAIAGIVTSSSVDLTELYTAIFDDVATQMRLFYDSFSRMRFALQRIVAAHVALACRPLLTLWKRGLPSQSVTWGRCHDYAVDYK